MQISVDRREIGSEGFKVGRKEGKSGGEEKEVWRRCKTRVSFLAFSFPREEKLESWLLRIRARGVQAGPHQRGAFGRQHEHGGLGQAGCESEKRRRGSGGESSSCSKKESKLRGGSSLHFFLPLVQERESKRERAFSFLASFPLFLLPGFCSLPLSLALETPRRDGLAGLPGGRRARPPRALRHRLPDAVGRERRHHRRRGRLAGERRGERGTGAALFHARGRRVRRVSG